MKCTLLLMTVVIFSVIAFSGCENENNFYEPGNLVPKTADQDPSVPSININGTALHSEAFGQPDNPLVIVIHGGPGSDYRSLLKCKEFANHGYRVVFYDQRGSGLSQRFSKSSYSMQIMYDELTGVINYYKTFPNQKVFLLGHSWGAMLATAYINKYPTTINGAILAEPGGFIWQDVIDYVGRTRGNKITGEVLNDITYVDQFITGKEDEHVVLDYKFGLLFTAGSAKDNQTGIEEIQPYWRGGAIISKALFEIGNSEKPNWTTNLVQFSTKVLFVYSEKNKAYGFEYAQKVSSVYPNVQLFKALGTGHDMLFNPIGWNNTYPTMLTYLNSLN